MEKKIGLPEGKHCFNPTGNGRVDCDRSVDVYVLKPDQVKRLHDLAYTIASIPHISVGPLAWEIMDILEGKK